ncbi:hypothetical protein ACHAXR_009247 [Thalassiosira sp. AJA248-18]
MALAAIALASTTNNNVRAFQPSRPMALSAASVKRNAPFAATSTFNRQQQTSIHMTVGTQSHGEADDPQSTKSSSLFQSTSQKTRRTLQKLRRSFTILVASFAFFLSSTRVMHTPPAHAASTATATTTSSSTLSLTQKLNPFRTRSADEMIDAYVRDRLFADDVYDPVESAYREAYADGSVASGSSKDGSSSSSATSSGAYPTLLAETAGAALGQQKSVSSLVSSASSGVAGGSSTASAGAGKNDGITAVLIKASDFLQSKLKVNASVSYYILAAGGIFGTVVLPGMVGVVYQGIQRLQIDKSEMKMYGKISDMDATSKKVTDDDDDDDDDEE